MEHETSQILSLTMKMVRSISRRPSANDGLVKPVLEPRDGGGGGDCEGDGGMYMPAIESSAATATATKARRRAEEVVNMTSLLAIWYKCFGVV